MNDPTRLMDADASEFERLLLRTAADERPSSEVSARMLAGVASAGAAVALLSSAHLAGEGVSGAVASGAAGSIAPPAAASLAGAWVVKWGVLGTLVAAAGLSGWLVLGSADRSEAGARPVGGQAVPAPAAALAAPTQELVQEDTPRADEETATAKAPAPVPAPRGARTVKPALGPEIELLDTARRALAAGDAERTLSLISSYRRRFPAGALDQEATVLEVDALEAKGRTGQASELKERFVAEHPESAHVERVQRSGSTR
jgi:hypothetical protein